jgi:hypothetical protein
MKNTKTILIILSAITITTLGLASYFYYQLKMTKQNPNEVSAREINDLVSKVSKLIVLPTDEAPTIATVSDPAALKEQSFFAQAEVGDKVLIYTKAKKAILYSVILNKILEVAPLNIGEKSTSEIKNEVINNVPVSNTIATSSKKR